MHDFLIQCLFLVMFSNVRYLDAKSDISSYRDSNVHNCMLNGVQDRINDILSLFPSNIAKTEVRNLKKYKLLKSLQILKLTL